MSMQQNVQSVTRHPSGEMVYSFLLTNSAGTIVEITNYGAIIMAIKLRNDDGLYNDVVLGFDKPELYWDPGYLKNYPYYGAAIGRYANRIKGAVIHIDGKKYELNGQVDDYVLHGGKEGFDKKIWDVVSYESNRLVLQYLSIDGEEGFPGQVGIMITFELTEKNELSYEYIATTDKATAINLTHHSYFNLNNGQGTIGNHYLKIHASSFLEQDDTACATGVIKSVVGTRNDFQNFQQTANITDADTGIDISFPLDRVGVEHVAAEAYCDGGNVKLEVYTTEPLVHLYNAYAAPTIIGKSGTQYTPFSGFCFETQKHPNAINIPSFPNTILRPGEAYRSKTIYRFVEI